jgi:hypothetical protein
MQGFHHLMPVAHRFRILARYQMAWWPTAFFLTLRGTLIKLVEAVRDSGVEKARIARLGERQHKPRLVW